MKAIATELIRTGDLVGILIYVSNGYIDFDQVRFRRDRPELTYDALRSDVVIYALDPRDLAGSTARDPKLDDAAERSLPKD